MVCFFSQLNRNLHFLHIQQNEGPEAEKGFFGKETNLYKAPFLDFQVSFQGKQKHLTAITMTS